MKKQTTLLFLRALIIGVALNLGIQVLAQVSSPQVKVTPVTSQAQLQPDK